MTKSFVLNGKTVVAKEFDFNVICDLEDMGLNIEAISTKTFSYIRGYVAVCLGISISEAGAEIQKHITNGGSVAEISEVFSEVVINSDFFRTLTKNKNQTATKIPKKQTKKSESEEVE